MILLLLLLALPPPSGARLLRQGKPAEAAALLEKQLAREPRNAALANDLGFAYARLGRSADAERLYRRAIALAPARFYAWANLAELFSQAPDRWERADQILGFLAQGLAVVPPEGFANLSVRVADFERSVGRTAQARARLLALRAQPLAADDERRIADLQGRIAQDERARAAEDWPEPAVPPELQARLREAERAPPAVALPMVDRLCAQSQAWQAARWLRARLLESVGRVDEAARELGVLTQLAPSHAQAWRRLGEILAQHGGLLEADRADEALRHALALEPSWTGLWLLRARVALRRGRAQDALGFVRRAGPPSDESLRLEELARAQAAAPSSEGAAQPPSREPTPEARALYQQAQEWRAEPELSRGDLLRALQLSPGFVEAAAAFYGLSGAVPDATLQALHDDGPGLLELAAQVRRAGAPAAVVQPWLDRAVELATPEARFERALLFAELGDRARALTDLIAYVASAPRPPHLEEARALRAQLLPPSRLDSADLQARLELAEDRPQAALAALGGRCAAGLRPRRLLAIGEVYEYAGALVAAAACYQLAANAGPGDPGEALQRLSRVAARAPSPALTPDLQRAADRGIADADWALARLSPSLPRIDRFLANAPADDPFLADARAAKASLERSSLLAAQQRQRRNLALALGALALALVAGWLLWAGATVESALARAPSLFPTLLRTVAEVRHDVIKHRASVLGMAGENREEVARALLLPEPASQVVIRAFERLRIAARAQGVSLRRLSREPSFGPLVRDLARAEALLRDALPPAAPAAREAAPSGASPARAGESSSPRAGESSPPRAAESSPPRAAAEIAALDVRIRTVHSQRMAALLRLGPRTRLDAGAVAAWIHAVEAEVRQGGAFWTSPSILLQGMEVEFPVEQAALATIFTNLLRNAQAAAAPDGRVIVRLARERDAAGRDLHVLLVGDSAPQSISLDAIESRESGRGLAIVRDLTREWHGHMIVRPEDPPWRKAVGACFPAVSI